MESQRQHVIIVAHGDTLSTIGECMADEIIYEADFCSWMVLDLNLRTIIRMSGIRSFPL